MKGAEEDYLELEKELDKQIRQMESTHPGYDEYRYQLDEIGHDPYQLISHLTAVYEQFTRGQVKPVIKELFKQQYLLKVWETIEIRTRMETRVGVRPTIDAFGNISMALSTARPTSGHSDRTAAIVCWHHWKFWMRRRISNDLPIFLPNVPSVSRSLLPRWIHPAKLWRFPLEKKQRWMCRL